MAKIVTFGEVMLRLSPVGYNRLFQTESLEGSFGGGEANVAVSLAQMGDDAAFVSKFPQNMVGEAALRKLKAYGVNTSHILRGGKRMGIYYMEKGASQRPSVCIYDREGSSFQTSKPEEYCWKEIMQGAQWFHFTGITPALGKDMVSACLDACKAAKEVGATISCDLNYRGKLWSREDAMAAMSELCQYVDVCIGNESDAADVFGVKLNNSQIVKGKLDMDEYRKLAETLMDRFPFRKVAMTLRESISASDNDWSAMIYDGEQCYFSTKYHLHMVDRVGGGDAFAGGLIHSLAEGRSPKYALEFAVAASALKHSINGDFNLVTPAEVETLMNGDGSGRVQR